MSNWVKFSDRMPTEFDANFSKEVIAMSDNGTWHTVMLPHALHNPSWYEHHFWLENVPKPPRTLDDVVRDYLSATGDISSRVKLQKEMKSFIKEKE